MKFERLRLLRNMTRRALEAEKENKELHSEVRELLHANEDLRSGMMLDRQLFEMRDRLSSEKSQVALLEKELGYANTRIAIMASEIRHCHEYIDGYIAGSLLSKFQEEHGDE